MPEAGSPIVLLATAPGASGEVSAATAALARAGWAATTTSVTAALAGEDRSWPPALAGVVAIGADPRDLAELVLLARRRLAAVPVVVLVERADGDLLIRLHRAGGATAYGLVGDDVTALLARAAATEGCATSPALAAAFLDRLAGTTGGRDLDLAAILLAGDGPAHVIDEVTRRPELLEAVVGEAVERALKRLALGAAPGDRAWLAAVLHG